MLEENTPIIGPSSLKECKPDYEQMISNDKEKLVLNSNLQNAIFEYMGYTRLRNKIAEMVGELVSEERNIKKNIERMISEQERA